MKSFQFLTMVLFPVFISMATVAYSQTNSATMFKGTVIYLGNTGSYFGQSIESTGIYSFAGGLRARATGNYSLSLGLRTLSSNDNAYALGMDVQATNKKSFAFGSGVGQSSPLVNSIANSFMVGFNSTVPTFFVSGSSGGSTTGKVGIGTTIPLQNLDVNGRIHVRDGVIQRGGLNPITNTSDLGLYSLESTYWMRFVTNNAPFKFFSDGGSNPIGGMNKALLTIEPDGNVYIGTNSANNLSGHYKLSVCGPVRATEVVVEENWCDYVFEKDYELTPLKDVEAHIQAKGYLHNTPSGDEIENNGLDVGAMTANQQEKIEELFLHMIAMDKRMKDLETENIELKKELQFHNN